MNHFYKLFVISTFLLSGLNSGLSALAQEDDSQPEYPAPIRRIPYSQDALIFIEQSTSSDPETNVTLSGFYKIIMAQLSPLETAPKDKGKCQTLLKASLTDKNFDAMFIHEEACLDLNEDKELETVFWGLRQHNAQSKLKRYPFALTQNKQNQDSEPRVVLSVDNYISVTAIKKRPSLSNVWNGWAPLILMDLDQSSLTLRPMGFDSEKNAYSPTAFSYDSDEVVFSTEHKKLAYDSNISSIDGDSLVLNRSGSLMGYIHGEGVANAGFGVGFLAAFDIKAKKFRHIDIFKHPTFQKAVNNKYPGFLSRALQSNPGGDGNDPISQKVIGFQNRDLLFKASVYSINTNGNTDTKFCGYWKFNVDSGTISLVSWNSSAAINVEHTGYVPKVIAE